MNSNKQKVTVEHTHILQSGILGCIDGRMRRGVVGTPGGMVGELVIVMGVVERKTGREFSEEQIIAVMKGLVAKGVVLGGHTDEGAMINWIGGVTDDAEEVELEKVAAVVGEENMRKALTETACDSGNVGCGHMTLMMERSDQYGVRRNLVEGIWKGLWRAWWEGWGDEQVMMEVLPGVHDEVGILVVNSSQTETGELESAVVAARQVEGGPFFVVHEEAAAAAREQLLAMVSEHVGVVLKSRDMEFASQLATLHRETTVEALAADLPKIELKSGDNLSLDLVKA